MKNWKTSKLKQLAKIFLSIDNEKDMLNFMRDLLTLEELEEFSSRWEAARLLGNKAVYRDIAKKTGMSTATVTRIAHWLKHGEGGYEKVLSTLGRKKKTEKKR